MKNSTTYTQDTTGTKQHVCSEKTCITCFENRGCMYDQYSALANTIQAFQLAKQHEATTQQ